MLHTCRDHLDFAGHDNLEVTAGMVASLAFELRKTGLPGAERAGLPEAMIYQHHATNGSCGIAR